jgi:hypothetical protein
VQIMMISLSKIRNRRLWKALLFVPLLAAAHALDRRSYTPPPQPGYIYVVVAYAGTAEPTRVNVAWGTWRGTASFPRASPGPGGGPTSGVVIRMRHHKADSVPLTVETNGRITLGPYQGDPPEQWQRADFRSEAW